MIRIADFIPRQWDDNAVTTFLKRYQDCEKEVRTAQKRLERLEYQAAKDARYSNGVVRAAIEEDRRRISKRIITAERVKTQVLDLLAKLPNGDERRVLELYYISNTQMQDIADVMGYSERSAWSLRERGVKMLIDYLGGKNDGTDENK